MVPYESVGSQVGMVRSDTEFPNPLDITGINHMESMAAGGPSSRMARHYPSAAYYAWKWKWQGAPTPPEDATHFHTYPVWNTTCYQVRNGAFGSVNIFTPSAHATTSLV